MFMKNFEKILIEKVDDLKQPTIYFYLKNHRFGEHYIKNLRNSEGSIQLNGKPVNVREKIKCGDILEIEQNPNKKTSIQLCDGDLEILYEDNDFLIVNKPHNLTCTPTRSHFSNNLGGQVCKYMKDKDDNFVLRVMNRLDRETAGIVVIAKHVIAANNIKIDKEYHALCNGNIKSPFTIDKPILTKVNNGINEHKRLISPDGKRSVTHVTPLKNFKGTCLIKLILETGRTHQIRVHMQSCGHSLIGDTLYGNNTSNTQSAPKEKNPSKTTPVPSHALLLLKKISFTHFRNNKEIEIEIPYPSDWNI